MRYNKTTLLVEDYDELVEFILNKFNVNPIVYSSRKYSFVFEKMAVELSKNTNFSTSLDVCTLTSSDTVSNTVESIEIPIKSYNKYVNTFNYTNKTLSKVVSSELTLFEVGESVVRIERYPRFNLIVCNLYDNNGELSTSDYNGARFVNRDELNSYRYKYKYSFL